MCAAFFFISLTVEEKPVHVKCSDILPSPSISASVTSIFDPSFFTLHSQRPTPGRWMPSDRPTQSKASHFGGFALSSCMRFVSCFFARSDGSCSVTWHSSLLLTASHSASLPFTPMDACTSPFEAIATGPSPWRSSAEVNCARFVSFLPMAVRGVISTASDWARGDMGMSPVANS